MDVHQRTLSSPSLSPKREGEKVYLDMDGVLVDFVGGALAAHSRPSPYTSPVAYGSFELEPLLHMSTDEFWGPLNSYKFWANLAPTPESFDIVELVSERWGRENVDILTAPAMGEGCVPGKRAWISQYFPHLASRIIFTGAKGFVAGPGRTLLDDRDKNITAWEEAGGRGVTVPRLWNALYSEAHSTLDYLRREILDDTK